MSILTPDGSRISLDGPASLPIVIPHLIGFHPVRSLVVIGLDACTSAVRVTCRVDLPDESLVTSDWVPVIRALQRAHCVGAIVAVYPDAGESLADLPAVSIVESVAEGLSAAGFIVRDALAISGLRYRSYWCADDGCCPQDGIEPGPEHVLALSAALVLEGSAPRASRDDIFAALAARSPGDPVMVELAQRRGGIEMRLPSGAAAKSTDLVAALASEDELSLSALIRLMVFAAFVCSDVVTRDLFLYHLTRHPHAPTLARAREVLSEVVRCYEGNVRAGAATCLAVCAWVSGDGASARVAADVALDTDPSYRLAALVAVALDDGHPPKLWAELVEQLSPERLMGAPMPSAEI